ncbi:MAG: hypothetical protein H7Y88_10350 [Phycisphaerales bacterium]|nr:hypothetical protein [Phycisphaerales bacterium]
MSNWKAPTVDLPSRAWELWERYSKQERSRGTRVYDVTLLLSLLRPDVIVPLERLDLLLTENWMESESGRGNGPRPRPCSNNAELLSNHSSLSLYTPVTARDVLEIIRHSTAHANTAVCANDCDHIIVVRFINRNPDNNELRVAELAVPAVERLFELWIDAIRGDAVNGGERELMVGLIAYAAA